MALVGIVDIINDYRTRLLIIQPLVGEDEMGPKLVELQQFFNQTLWPHLTEVELVQQSRWNAVTTELYRGMRLLQVEVSFAQTAGQLRQHRLEQIRQRIVTLQEFTQALLTLIADAE